MEIFTLTDTINVFCVTADSFPDGVLTAHQKLHGFIPFNRERKYFGISYPDKTGTIIYKAAAAELEEGELKKHGLEEMTILKGNYIYTDVKDFMKNISAIGESFGKLIHGSRIDPNGFCLEWYMDNDVCRCMVRMKDDL